MGFTFILWLEEKQAFHDFLVLLISYHLKIMHNIAVQINVNDASTHTESELQSAIFTSQLQ